jgi:hypothetical protein
MRRRSRFVSASGLADVDPNREPYIRFRDVFGVTF